MMGILGFYLYILKDILQSKQSALEDPGINNLTQALRDWKIALEISAPSLKFNNFKNVKYQTVWV